MVIIMMNVMVIVVVMIVVMTASAVLLLTVVVTVDVVQPVPVAMIDLIVPLVSGAGVGSINIVRVTIVRRRIALCASVLRRSIRLTLRALMPFQLSLLTFFVIA